MECLLATMRGERVGPAKYLMEHLDGRTTFADTIPDGSLVYAISRRHDSLFPDELTPRHIPESIIVGRKKTFDLIPNYAVTMIEDLNGRLHFFDGERLVSSVDRELSPQEIRFAKKAAHSQVADIDTKRVFRYWCEQDKFHKRQPYYKDLKRLVDRSVVKGRDVVYYLAGCFGGAALTVGLKDIQSKWENDRSLGRIREGLRG
jgi:hypothetical protein